MPLQRSPTSSNSTAQVQSEPDIPSKMNLEFESSFVSTRNKRLRIESQEGDTDTDKFTEFKNEIKNMLCLWKTDQDSAFATWKSEQDSMFKKLVLDITEVKSKCNDIQKTNQELEKSLEFINRQYDEMQSRIKALEREKKENRDSLLSLEGKIQELQRMSRSSTIEIRNIPQNEKETTADLVNTVLKIGTALNVNLQPADVRDISRGYAKPGSHGNITVEFTKVQLKYDILTSARNFNKLRKPAEKLNTQHIGLPGENKPFYIDEHLSPSLKKLFFEARVYAKENGYKFCWTSNSRVFLRKEQGSKQILIRSEQCLRDLEVKQ